MCGRLFLAAIDYEGSEKLECEFLQRFGERFPWSTRIMGNLFVVVSDADVDRVYWSIRDCLDDTLSDAIDFLGVEDCDKLQEVAGGFEIRRMVVCEFDRHRVDIDSDTRVLLDKLVDRTAKDGDPPRR